MGSPLYADLLRRAAADAERGGPACHVLEPHVAPGRGGALALRFMAAVHRLVLTGAAPELARHYPTAGGDATRAGVWDDFRQTLGAQGEELRRLVARPCQTNEVGRCAGLLFGFLEAAHRTRLPLRLLEVGASAGLNLRWDHFLYGDREARWGRADSEVDLRGLWNDLPAHLEAPVEVFARHGCDLHPLDPAQAEDRLSLESSVWADQLPRWQRLRGALALAARIPATVERASLSEWLPARLAEPTPGITTVVFHSVVEEYLEEQRRTAFHLLMEEAGARSSSRAPLAWVRLEPLPGERRHLVTLQLWPGGEMRALARCGAHGTDVRRC